MVVVSLLTLLFGACAPTDILVSTQTSTLNPEPSEVADSSTQETQGPVLSNALVRGCERIQAPGGFENVGLVIGEPAVDFILQDVNGNTVSLAGLLMEKPVVIVFGSFTWPPFRRQCAANDTLAREYGDEVHFIIIYTKEAHAIDTGRPLSYTYDDEGNPIYEPQTYEERQELARKTVDAEGITVRMLVDEMDNPLWCTYGPAPHIAYLIGTEGNIVAKQGWYSPEQMESAILAYISNN